MTVILLSGAPLEVVQAQVEALLGALGIGADAVALALPLVIGPPEVGPFDEFMPDQGVASRQVRRTGMPRRAAYLLSAVKRLAGGGSIDAERRYLSQHLGAERARVQAARRVDIAAAEHGPLLGWRARMDRLTTRACRSAHGHNFRAERPPILPEVEEGGRLMGYPGTLHGGSCRCVPVPPFAGATMLG